MKPPVTVLAIAVVAALARPAAPQVTIRTFAFGPRSLVVPVGTTVMWTNADEIEHTVTWSYFCKRHSFMRGEIRVTPKGER